MSVTTCEAPHMTFGQYEAIGSVGLGCMGEVYRMIAARAINPP
jgi:hypothetical protein